MKFLLVFVGGGLGAMARYFVTTNLAGKLGNFPLGTLTANILGSFLMGLVIGIIAGRSSLENARLLLAVGFLGGFTTFSSFSAETLTLIQNGQIFLAAANILISVAAGLAACFAGLTLTKF
ncbi:MAG: fluoride efflux transporter CrcB [Selenomonadaceae bacterium]|nr:fluoride efflux transporter CrcB [Selenomonadaceae bacterium]